MEPSNEEQPPILDRTSRETRGKRMTKLLDDELEEDEAFWNQDALLEEENDGEYEAEPEIADEFDSDFGEDEPEPDDGVQNEAEAREKRPKKRLIYTGKPQTKKKKKKKDLSKLEESLKDEMNKDVSEIVEVPDEEKRSGQPTTSDHREEGDEAEGEKSVRKSTRTAVIVRQAEREAIRAALQATMKPVKRKKEGEEKRMSQEEMLLEAAQTEIMNLRHLERVLAREEEVKKRAIVHKAVYTGPQMRYSSKNGSLLKMADNALAKMYDLRVTDNVLAKMYDLRVTHLSNSEMDYHLTLRSLQNQFLGLKALAKPLVNKEGILNHWDTFSEKALCVVTGLPAKYRDPKTGLPYATKEAFQIIRERYSAENNRAENKLASGDLYDSIIGQGFMGKRKRSSTPHLNEISYAQTSRRFCRIPSADNLDSD